MICPDTEALSIFLDGEIEAPWKLELADHLKGCRRCRHTLGGLQRVQHRMLEDTEPDVRAALARIWRRMDVSLATYAPTAGFWRRSIGVPLPALLGAVLAAGLVVAGAIGTFSRFGLMRITTEPSGVTELKVAAPLDEIERLLAALGRGSNGGQKIIIEIPGERDFALLGQPAILREDELPRRRQ